MKVILALIMAGIMMAAMIAPAMGGDADTSATVGNVAPVVESVVILDPGSMNFCPDTTVVPITAIVSDANGVGDIASVQITDINPAISGAVVSIAWDSDNTATEAVYKGTITLPCCTEPGLDKYTITVTATDTGALLDTGTDKLTVPTSKGLSINFDKVSFGPAAPNTDDVPGSATLGVNPEAAPAAENIGNTVIDVSVGAGDLTGATHSEIIAGANMKADLTDTPDAGWLVLVPTKTFNTALACGGTSDTAFRLDIPNVVSDTYAGTLTISAV